MLKYTYIVLFIFINSVLYSQNYNQINGIVVNEHNEPFSNVNVFLKKSKKGTITNSNGAFSLNHSGDVDLVTFSYIGYKSQIIDVDSSTKHLRIKLLPAQIELSQIQVTNLTAEQLFDKAITKIPTNYPQEEYLSRMFYRASIFSKNDSLVYVEETLFEQLKSYQKNYNDKTFLVKNRYFNLLNKEFGIRGIGIYDNVKLLMDKGRHKSRKNILSFGTLSYYDGNMNYVLEINKDIKIDSDTKGKIFIDVESLAFVRFELSENNKTQTTQYKKIGEKYYLFSQEINHKNKTHNGGYENVKALFVVTEIANTFNNNDIKGTLVSTDEILRTYVNQENDVAFWKNHNSVLLDTNTHQKINRYLSEQGLSRNTRKKIEIEEYKKIYNPNITLRLSTKIPNDINNLSQNSTSLNLLTNYLLHKKIENYYLKLLVPSIINIYLVAPLEEVELERELLAKNGLHSKINPFMFNSFEKSYHYGISQNQLDNFKNSNYNYFMRLHTIRGEYHYQKTKILEEDIAKTDMSNRNNKNSYFSLYLMDLFYNRTYNIFYSQLKDKTTKIVKNLPLIVDQNKSWVKYLFEQNTTFNSHLKSDDLSSDEKIFLKRSALLSWMNLISPQMLSLDKFRISDNLFGTFSLNYLRIPFGEMTEQNFWIKYKNQLNGLFFRQYINKESVGFGLGYKMYDLKLNSKINLTTAVDYWTQPLNLNFYNTIFKSGFHINQDLEYKFGQKKFSKQNKISLYLGYDYKTKGYLPECLELSEQFKVNFGIRVNF